MLHIPDAYMLRWEINTECNLSCIHCCNADSSIDRSNPDMSMNDIISTVQRLSQEGLRRIHFLGGEPLLREDFLEICTLCAPFGVDLSFNTNGLFLNHRNILRKVLDIPFSSITISIDGVDPESHDTIRGKGTFHRVVNAIKELVEERKRRGEHRPLVVIQSTLTRLWHKRVSELFILARELGVQGIVINNLALEGRAKQHENLLSLSKEEEFWVAGKILQNAYEYSDLVIKSPFRTKVALYYRRALGIPLPGIPMNCPGAINSAYVLPDGLVVPCVVAQIQGMGNFFSKLRIQDVNTEALWNSAYFTHFRSIVHGPIEDVYKNVHPCNKCGFLGNLCKPCPLNLDPGADIVVSPCKLAMERLESCA
ncbi:MAG: radical SAM protein [Anaerolineae bacterium]|nr:radical SAM protein [Anaerolineae bacterium]